MDTIFRLCVFLHNFHVKLSYAQNQEAIILDTKITILNMKSSKGTTLYQIGNRIEPKSLKLYTEFSNERFHFDL